MDREQIIYLGPEEELTNVRERLENTNAGRIILVIPPQTQLRSHVGWRLLHSRVRELNLDVLIISSDRQIRSVAKAAGFRVADSFESAPSDSPRPTNRPVRSDSRRKISQGTNKQGGTGNKASRSLQTDQQKTPPSSSKNGRALSSSADIKREFDTAASSTFEIESVPYDDHYELPFETVPPPFGEEDQEEGEVDSLVRDYYVARDIRKAAQSSKSGEVSSAIENTETSVSNLEQTSKIPQPSEMENDPFAYMEDIQPIALPEQHASTFIHDIDQGIPDISDVPTDVHDVEVEDLGDDVSPQRNYMGNTVRQSLDDFGKEDDLLPASVPIADQPTRITPSPAARVSTPSTTARREPQPMSQPSPQKRNVTTNPTLQQSKKPITTKSSPVFTNPPLNKRAGSNSNRNVRRILAFVSISLGVLLLALLAFIYFSSNATVTVVVPSQPLNVSKQYVASTDQQNSQQNTIPSQVLTYTASATGHGTATGTIKQGNQFASGIVTFTNNGSNSLDIPTGTVLSTSGPVPVQFVTVADVLVQSDKNTNAIPSVAPVQAQIPGESGNVAANSITLIPPDSLTKIAQNNSQSSLAPNTLTVTNPSSTTGGGAANVQAVSSNDVNTLAATLQSQVQNEIKAWLARVVHPGAVAGTPIPNVQASPTPLSEEKMVTMPSIGQPAPGGKFSGVLSVKVSVLVIRNAAIQTAGRAQLTATALHMNPPSVLTTKKPVTVKVTKSTPSQDGTNLSITVDATGYAVQKVSAQQINQQLAGKSVDDARSFINSGQAGIKGAIDTTVVLFPPFLGFMPFRADQIHIVVQPGPIPGIPNG